MTVDMAHIAMIMSMYLFIFCFLSLLLLPQFGAVSRVNPYTALRLCGVNSISFTSI